MRILEPEEITKGFDTNPRLQISRAAGRFSRSMISLANRGLQAGGHDISLEHAIILKHLMDKEGQSQQELAENTFKHKTSITFLIDKMVKKNLVVRVPDQLDRRNKLIFLTEKGKNMLSTIFPILFDQAYQITEGIDSNDLQVCVRVLETLLGNAQKQLSEPPS